MPRTCNKKVRKLALKSALSAKQKDGKLIVWDARQAGGGKTGGLAAKLKTLGNLGSLP